MYKPSILINVPTNVKNVRNLSKTRRGVKDQIRVHHEEQVELECQKCEKKFGNEVPLRAHYQQSHGTQNNSFVCDSCGKSFKLKQSLKMHCLSEHSNIEDQEKYKIQCHHPGCNFASLQKRAVEEHFERIHLKLKKFLCSHCPKSFYNKMRLDEHTNGVHLNKKPFKCELCNFATAYRSIHNEHKKVAHGNQRFDCPIPNCTHWAKYKGNLLKHVQNVHKKA